MFGTPPMDDSSIIGWRLTPIMSIKANDWSNKPIQQYPIQCMIFDDVDVDDKRNFVVSQRFLKWAYENRKEIQRHFSQADNDEHDQRKFPERSAEQSD